MLNSSASRCVAAPRSPKPRTISVRPPVSSVIERSAFSFTCSLPVRPHTPPIGGKPIWGENGKRPPGKRPRPRGIGIGKRGPLGCRGCGEGGHVVAVHPEREDHHFALENQGAQLAHR